MAPSFAVIGTGQMAATMMACLSRAGVPVKAVASGAPDRGSAFANAFNIPFHSSLGVVLARSDVDVVYVANAPKHHAATVIAALRAGKAVLCEKPIATSATELAEIIGAAQDTGLLCMEAMWTLLLPSHRRFLDYANSRHWGEPRSLFASFGYPRADGHGRHVDAIERGGVVLDRGVYLLALAVSTLGPATMLSCQTHFNAAGVASEAFMQVSHHTGAQSLLATSFTSLLPNNATLHCTRGMIAIDPPLIGSEAVSTSGTSPYSDSSDAYYAASASYANTLKAVLRRSSRLRRLKRTFIGPKRHHLPFGVDAYIPQLKHFLTLFEQGRTQSDIVPLSLSLDVLKLIDTTKHSPGG